MSRPIVVALSGPSGAGKSTTVSRLAQRPGWAALDEAFYRLRPRPRLGYRDPAELLALERRLLREESRRFAEGERLADSGLTVVVDTGFLDPVDYTAGLVLLGRAPVSTLRRLLADARARVGAGRLGISDLTVDLGVSPAGRAERVASDPRGHPRAFRERHESVGVVIARELRPAIVGDLPGRLVRVRATAPPELVAARVVRQVARVSPWADRSAAAARWLRAVERRTESLLARRPPPYRRGRSGQS